MQSLSKFQWPFFYRNEKSDSLIHMELQKKKKKESNEPEQYWKRKTKLEDSHFSNLLFQNFL